MNKKVLTCHIAGMELKNPIEIRENEPIEWAMARRISELEEEVKSSCPASEVKELESDLEEARKETTRIGIKNGELRARIIKLESKLD